MNKKDFLNYLKNDVYCRLRPSNIHGIGIFAVKKIPKNTDPFRTLNQSQKYIRLSKKEVGKLDPEIQNIIKDYYVSGKKIIEIPNYGLNEFHIACFLNHSGNPNIKTIDGGENFITIRDIEAGEEITSDYNQYDKKGLDRLAEN